MEQDFLIKLKHAEFEKNLFPSWILSFYLLIIIKTKGCQTTKNKHFLSLMFAC